MSGRKSKALRRKVYGDFSFRHRTYSRDPVTKTIHADARRHAYQQAKKGK